MCEPLRPTIVHPNAGGLWFRTEHSRRASQSVALVAIARLPFSFLCSSSFSLAHSLLLASFLAGSVKPIPPAHNPRWKYFPPVLWGRPVTLPSRRLKTTPTHSNIETPSTKKTSIDGPSAGSQDGDGDTNRH